MAHSVSTIYYVQEPFFPQNMQKCSISDLSFNQRKIQICHLHIILIISRSEIESFYAMPQPSQASIKPRPTEYLNQAKHQTSVIMSRLNSHTATLLSRAFSKAGIIVIQQLEPWFQSSENSQVLFAISSQNSSDKFRIYHPHRPLAIVHLKSVKK
jgi:hypothetical protein